MASPSGPPRDLVPAAQCNPRLYATDFHNGHIDVFDANFQPVKTGQGNDKGKGDDQGDDNSFFSGKPRGFAPVNIQNIGDTLFVAFAKQDAAKHDNVDGPVSRTFAYREHKKLRYPFRRGIC